MKRISTCQLWRLLKGYWASSNLMLAKLSIIGCCRRDPHDAHSVPQVGGAINPASTSGALLTPRVRGILAKRGPSFKLMHYRRFCERRMNPKCLGLMVPDTFSARSAHLTGLKMMPITRAVVSKSCDSKGLRCLGALKAHIGSISVFCPVSGKALPCCGGAA